MKIKFVNYSHVKIEADDSVIYSLRDHFAFEAPGYKFNPKYRYGVWDGKIRLMGFDGLLPFGLYEFAIKWAENNDVPFSIDQEIIDIKEDNTQGLQQWLKDTPVYNNKQEITPHWYQEAAFIDGINNKRRILNLPTSAGKSLIQGMISKWFIQRNQDKVLILVPTVGLTHQMSDDFRDYGLFSSNDIQLIGDGKKSTDQTFTKLLLVTFGDITIRIFPTDKVRVNKELIEVKSLKVGLKVDIDWLKNRYRGINTDIITNIDVQTIESPIIVSTWQSAMRQKPEWFEQFGMLINDECHLSDGKSISKINHNLYKCKYKLGLTGTLKDGKTHLMQYIGLFGNVFKPVSTKQLMDEGQVTKLDIKSIFLKYPDDVIQKAGNMDYQKEIKVITSYQKRNRWVVNLAKKLADNKENVFIMFRLKEHGKWLYDELSKVHTNLAYIDGDVKTDQREEAKTDMESGKGMITIASYGVFSTGISIKNLHHVIFAHPVKSKITVLQTIGRVLRKHDSKDIATLWDLVDVIAIETKSKTAKSKYRKQNYALTHAFERIDRYIEEDFNFKIHNINL